MDYLPLDQSTIISRFCFGCEPLGGTDWGDDVDVCKIEESIELALDYGVNFFDTADVYGLGLSEIRLSKILANRRHDLIIATKGGVSWQQEGNARAVIQIDSSPEYIRSAFEQSLGRLKVEKIHVYYIHKPEKNKDVGPAIETLYELQHDNKIGVIGCSNFSAEQLQRALEFAPIRFLQIPVNILIDRPPLETVKICEKNNVGIVGYNVLASGLLAGKISAKTIFPSCDRRSRLPEFIGKGLNKSIGQVELLRKDANREGLSLAQYSIKRAMEFDAVEAAIIGIKQPKQLKENMHPFS
jgi:aryl-alcohol dehydrogenase-like predicted oxidoreductase